VKEFPPFRLDAVNQCLWRSGSAGSDERVLLTPKAFAVLRLLVEHAGSLVSQDALLDAAWRNTHVEPAVLNNQILHLRHALGDHPRHPVFIETLSRRGYRFIAAVHDTANSMDCLGEGRSTKLIGRRAELLALRESLSKALKDIRQILFVTGETGIGKTALLDEFQRWAGANVPDIRIVRGQCIEGYGGKEPYYPMLEALNQLCHGPDGDSVIRILASHAPTWLAQFPALMKSEHLATLQREILGATRERMLREIGEALEVIASTHPLALFFDDVHWVDPATVDLISALARHRAPAKLMVVSTYRPADVDPSNAIGDLMQELLIHDLCFEIALEPLTESETTELLADKSSGTSSAEALGSVLYRHSEGNPLFVVAALEHLSKRGLIAKLHGAWQPKVPLAEIALSVPDNLRRMIEARIERLTNEEQRVLEAASLHSVNCNRFAVSTRASLTEMDAEDFENVCDTLSRRHGILRRAEQVEFADGTVSACYEFVHELYREVCYQRISAGRRVKLHQRLGNLVEARLAPIDRIR
jgi:predicted ATPase